MDSRPCLKCGSTTNGFHKSPRHKDGLHPHCKACRKAAYAKRVASESPEKRQERRRKAAAYRARPERKQRQRELSDKWRSENPERARAHGRATDRRRADVKAEYNKQWRKENREVVAAHSRNRRAMVKSSDGEHTAADVLVILQAQRYRCAACRKDTRHTYHVDHIKALSRGGSNDKTNLQVLCPTCNNQKHAADPIDFMRRKGFLL